MNYQVHESAIVDEGAKIGDGTRIWHFAHICNRRWRVYNLRG
jgi:UDP-2-acetamido-3-amino-2,3-dideoxy-glucuronate N-acetyltransferase